MTDMQDKVVIVTGATGGQGEAEVRMLVAAGAKVIFGGRTVEDGERIAADLGEPAIFHRHDVGNSDEWAAVIALAERKFGRIDGLVNNAGITISGQIDELDPETVMKGLRTNQIGQLLGMKHVAPAMRRAGGGSIVNIGSEAGVRAYPGATAYSGSKAAIAGMTRSAAAELAGDRIRVNIINPGPIDTPMIEKAAGKGAAQKMGDGVPLGRVGQPEDIAHAVLFLLSDKAEWITGAEINIDGGRSIAPPPSG